MLARISLMPGTAGASFTATVAELAGADAKIKCSACGNELDVAGYEPFSTVPCPACATPLVVPKPLAHFLLLGPIGTGGMGTVYRAMDLALHRYVAVKVLKKELADDEAFVADFAREARAAAALNHPNIAQVYSFNAFENQYYLVMELVDQGSLDGLIDERKRLSEIEGLEFGIQVASALRAAFQRGLIHRDVKPGNVLIADDGSAKLVDFGLAKFKDAEHGRDEGIWGTPYYLAPEKLHGQVGDFRSDMYSLGGTLFHCLAGRAPFEAATAEGVVEKNLTAAALSLQTFAPDISSATALLIARLLRKNPEERYPDYDSLIHDLQLAKSYAEKHLAARVQKHGQKKSSAGKWIQAAVLAAVTIGVLTWAIIGWMQMERRRNPRREEPRPPVNQNPQPPPHVNVPPAPPPDPLQSFKRANQMLNHSNFSNAYQSYATAAADLGNRPAEKDWAVFLQGISWLLDGNAAQAMRVWEPLTTAAADPPALPASITYENMPSALALIMADKIAVAAFEERAAALPPWGRAAWTYTRAVKEFQSDDYPAAMKSFRAYAELERAEERGWLFDFKTMAGKMADGIEFIAKTREEVKRRMEAHEYDKAIEEITKGRARIPAASPAFRRYWNTMETNVRRAADEWRQAEAARLRREKQEAEERLRLKTEEEKKLITDIDSEAQPLYATYAFNKVLKSYEALKPRCTTEGAQLLLASRLDSSWLLADLKQRLIADINATPYERTDLLTADQVAIAGAIARADEEKITVAKKSGEGSIEADLAWTDMKPAQIGKLAEYYVAVAAKTEPPPANLATRYLSLALFFKTFNFKKEAEEYARQSVRLDPGQKEQASQLFGKIFD